MRSKLMLLLLIITFLVGVFGQCSLPSSDEIPNAVITTLLPTPENEQDMAFDVDSVVEFECVEGFALGGEFQGETIFSATCIDGDVFQFSTSMTCQEMPVYDCIELPDMENGIIQEENPKEGYNVGDVLIIKCQDQYSLTGDADGPNTVTTQCQSTGVWSYMPNLPCMPHVYGLELSADNGQDYIFQMPVGGDVRFLRGPEEQSLSNIEMTIATLGNDLDTVSEALGNDIDGVRSELTDSLDTMSKNYDQQISDIQDDVSGLDTDLKALKSSHETLEGRVNTNDVSISDLDERLSVVERELQTTKSQLSDTQDELEQAKTEISTLQDQLASLMNCQKDVGIFDVSKPEAQRCTDKPVSAGVSFDSFSCTQATKSLLKYDEELGIMVCDGSKFIPSYIEPKGLSSLNPAVSCQEIADEGTYTGDGIYFLIINNVVVRNYCTQGGTKSEGGSGLTREEFGQDCGTTRDNFGTDGILWIGSSYTNAKKRYCVKGQDEGGDGSADNAAKSCDNVINIFKKPINNDYKIEGESQVVGCNDGLSAAKPVPSCSFLKTQTYMQRKEGLSYVIVNGKSLRQYCKDGQNEGGDGSSAELSSTSCAFITSAPWNKPQGAAYYVNGVRMKCGDGSSNAKAADNCWVIKSFYNSNSGTFYVDVAGSVMVVYCDNSRQNGGWMMIHSTNMDYGRINGEFSGGVGSPTSAGSSDYRIPANGNQLQSDMVVFSPSDQAEIMVMRWQNKATYVGTGLNRLQGLSGTCTSCNCGGNSLGGSYYWHGGRGPCYNGAHYGLSRNGNVHNSCGSSYHWGHFHRGGVDRGVYQFTQSCLTESKWAERFVFFLRPKM